jgi:hypothetical protein
MRNRQFPEVKGSMRHERPSQQGRCRDKGNRLQSPCPWLSARRSYASMKLEDRNMSLSADTAAVVFLFALVIDNGCENNPNSET